MIGYTSPVQDLLEMGRPRLRVWPQYTGGHLCEEHVPELIELATDRQLLDGAAEEPRVYGPIHAWRALAQLGSEQAIGPLVGVLAECEENDWAGEELPLVFEKLGVQAVPHLIEYLRNAGNGVYARAAAGAGLTRIAAREKSARKEVVEALSGTLEEFQENRSDLNGLLISNLLDLKAAEAASIIEAAYVANRVDLWINGDWEDVQVELGLRLCRSSPRPTGSYRIMKKAIAEPESSSSSPPRTAKSKKKKGKRKQAQNSRRRNRRKK